MCISGFSETPEAPQRWPETGWLDGNVDDLAACIELAALSMSIGFQY